MFPFNGRGRGGVNTLGFVLRMGVYPGITRSTTTSCTVAEEPTHEELGVNFEKATNVARVHLAMLVSIEEGPQ